MTQWKLKRICLLDAPDSPVLLADKRASPKEGSTLFIFFMKPNKWYHGNRLFYKH